MGAMEVFKAFAASSVECPSIRRRRGGRGTICL